MILISSYTEKPLCLPLLQVSGASVDAENGLGVLGLNPGTVHGSLVDLTLGCSPVLVSGAVTPSVGETAFLLFPAHYGADAA